MSNDEVDIQYQEVLRDALIDIEFLHSQIESYSEPIAVVGMSCRFPAGANSPEEFWNLLQRGEDGISEIPSSRWNAEDFYDPNPDVAGKMHSKLGGFLNVDIGAFDADFFGISPKEAEYLDPQQRLLLEVSYEALLSGGFDIKKLKNSKTGVFVGVCSHDYSDLFIAKVDRTSINPYIGIGNAHSAATGRIAYTWGFTGPNFAIDTACSSSLVAIDEACTSLRLRSSDLALAGGVNLILSPDLMINFSKAGMLAADGHCKTFDARADGYVRGEGCGMIVLKRLSDALNDNNHILAIIKSSAINQDGASSGLTVPNGNAQERLINEVLQKAQLKADDIDFVEAHGTGTTLGDPIELKALGQTYGQRDAIHPLMVGSVKTNIGHLEGAAGIAGVIKVILALQQETLPAHLHFKTLNPQIDANFPFEVVTSNRPWTRGDRVRRAGISSFGFSGTNAHVIIEEPPNSSLQNASSIALPQYHRKHYWISGITPTLTHINHSVHPLLGEVKTAPDNQINYYGFLRLADLNYLRDHQVYGQIIYPGAGFIEMFLAAGYYAFNDSHLELSKLTIDAVLPLTSTGIESQIIMKPHDKGYEVSIYSNNGHTWQMHAGSQVQVISSDSKNNYLELSAIKSRCTQEITGMDFYADVNKSGLSYGDTFQTLVSINSGDHEALGQLKLSISAKEYMAHPAILDGALQLLAVSLHEQENDEIYLPISCETFRLYSPLGENVYAYWQEGASNNLGRVGDITFCDDHGLIKAEIKGIQYRKTNKQALNNLLTRNITELIYDWSWSDYELKAEGLTSPWLVVSAGSEAQALAQELVQDDANHFTLAETPKTQDKMAWHELLNQNKDKGLVYIIGDEIRDQLTPSVLTAALDAGVHSVLSIVQELVQLDYKNPITLIIMKPLPAYSTVYGLFKTVFLEHPEINMKVIELDKQWELSALKNLLLNTYDELIVHVEGGHYSIPRLMHVPYTNSQTSVVIRSDASYLITGGLGGLGLILAKWLIQHQAGHIILTGRKSLNEEHTRLIQTLNTETTLVSYETLDVSRENEVQGLLNRHKQAQKPLKGIFHLAGILEDAILNEQDWGHFERVFATKVYGSWYLHQHASDLDLFVLYSSIAATLGSPGQSNYAAANAFMDSLCLYRRAQGLSGQSIAWGPWSEAGMARDLIVRHAKSGISGLTSEEGTEVLNTILSHPQRNISCVKINWSQYMSHLIEIPSWLKGLASKNLSQFNLITQLKTLPVEEHHAAVKTFVLEVMMNVLGVTNTELIDERKGFFDLGMDSLMAVEFKNQLQKGLGKEFILDATVIFDYANLEQMVLYLCQGLNIDVEMGITPILSEENKEEQMDKAIDEMDMDQLLKELKEF